MNISFWNLDLALLLKPKKNQPIVVQIRIKSGIIMAQNNLMWDSYSKHYQDLIANLLSTGESSNVTLVCDDQVKFKTHKFILKACSPVFERMLEEMNEEKAIVYLRGINQIEMNSILEYIYCRRVFIEHERLKELIRVGQDLQLN